jgi:nitroreductase
MVMEIPFSRWYPMITTRRSRRHFDPSQTLTNDLISSLQKTCSEFRPFPGARVALIPKAPDKVFKFIAGSYGIIRNAGAALIFIGDENNQHVHEEVGYTGEGLVLEASALGLSACWMAGFFRKGIISQFIEIKANEKILAVSPVGFAQESNSFMDNLMASFGRHSLRKPLADLTSGLPENEWPAWIKPALEAARLAPSAVNRQPWRFTIEPKSIVVSTDDRKIDYRVSKRMDCGIAMLHMEIAALNQGVKGQWQLLSNPQVARFKT